MIINTKKNSHILTQDLISLRTDYSKIDQNINGLLEKFKSNPEPSSLTKQNDPINEEDDYFDRGDFHSDFN